MFLVSCVYWLACELELEGDVPLELVEPVVADAVFADPEFVVAALAALEVALTVVGVTEVTWLKL